MKQNRKLGRGVAIVGAGMSQFGMFKDKDSKDLFADAFRELIVSVDKGFDPKDIDALYLGNFSNDYFMHQSHWGPIISDLVGIAPKPATRTEGACASSALAFREGVFAIASGFYDVVLVGGVEEMSKRTTEEVAEGLALATVPYEGRAGFTFPGVFGAVATAYFAAGRSARIDGGIRLHALDVRTGELLHKADVRVTGGPGANVIRQSVLPDILSIENDSVWMRGLGVNENLAPVPDEPHLFAPRGFLDDTWWHRSYWLYGRVWKSGAGGYYQSGRFAPSGRPMVFDRDAVLDAADAVLNLVPEK